jgi:hypothetical protein
VAIRNALRIDPDCLRAGEAGSELELVIPYTEPETTAAALERAAVLTSGLNANVLLVAVHTLPFPAPYVCPSLVHAHLVEQLMDLASHCALAVQPQVVLSRDRMEGFRFAIKAGSTVLLASRRRLWKTQEEKLAAALAEAGYIVALVHIA